VRDRGIHAMYQRVGGYVCRPAENSQNAWVKEAHTGGYNVRFKRVDQDVEKQHHRIHCVALHFLHGQLQDLAGMVRSSESKY